MSKDFEEGVHYYLENGVVCFTALFLCNRGFCCGNKCRHCPYDPRHEKGNTVKKDCQDLEENIIFTKTSL